MYCCFFAGREKSGQGNKRYQCYYCDEQCDDFQQLVSHLTDAHHAEHSELGIIIGINQLLISHPPAAAAHSLLNSDSFQDPWFRRRPISLNMA